MLIDLASMKIVFKRTGSDLTALKAAVGALLQGLPAQDSISYNRGSNSHLG